MICPSPAFFWNLSTTCSELRSLPPDPRARRAGAGRQLSESSRRTQKHKKFYLCYADTYLSRQLSHISGVNARQRGHGEPGVTADTRAANRRSRHSPSSPTRPLSHEHARDEKTHDRQPLTAAPPRHALSTRAARSRGRRSADTRFRYFCGRYLRRPRTGPNGRGAAAAATPTREDR